MSNQNAEVEFKPQFAGVWIPAEFALMWERGELSIQEMFIASYINSGFRDAPNSYFAKTFKMSADRTESSMKKLKTLGLI